jgi:ribonuclease P protein component
MAEPPRGFRFPATSRIKKTREFNRVYARGKRARGPLFLVVLAPNRLPVTRVGLSVGKRVGGAVRRNRIKRMLREAFRHVRPQLPPGLDIVLVAESLERKYLLPELQADLVRLVHKALAAPARPPRRGAP